MDVGLVCKDNDVFPMHLERCSRIRAQVVNALMSHFALNFCHAQPANKNGRNLMKSTQIEKPLCKVAVRDHIDRPNALP